MPKLVVVHMHIRLWALGQSKRSNNIYTYSIVCTLAFRKDNSVIVQTQRGTLQEVPAYVTACGSQVRPDTLPVLTYPIVRTCADMCITNTYIPLNP